MSKVVVVGGGPAGLMAASQAALYGNDVTLLEKNPRTGRKLIITGKGRCNITNACDNTAFISNVVSNPRFLYSAINGFDTSDTVAFFNSLGVETKVERGNRVFPLSDKAMDVADALLSYARSTGVRIVTESAVDALIIEESQVKGVLSKGRKYSADAVIIATGGKSYPLTGSTGDGYSLAESAGHTITDIVPSLVPLELSGNEYEEMQGLSLKNIAVSIVSEGKKIFEDFGELVFTHYGVSGPVILSASSHLSDYKINNYKLSIDLKPALDFDTLDKRLIRDFEKNNLKEAGNSLGGLLPSKMIPVVLSRWGIDKNTRCNSVTKEQRKALVNILKNLDFDIIGTRPIDEAIITRGGVKVSEINPKTMESKLIKGLYFCGEVLDVDAYTGGFNLQIAFSTGYLAGQIL
ncbi:MAG: NAD(P)/FAD-dependent oxidoreductase [Ruminococcaceae bacterium]|nr:NAD(P)/FAD-dependent oxidoreductase [Oscillospiraceae bacterium]